MCVFKEHNYGQPLPRPMIDFLSRYITKQDRKDIARKSGLSESLIRQVASGNMNLTKNNAHAIIMLMERSVENCGNVIDRAREDLKEYSKKLQHA